MEMSETDKFYASVREMRGWQKEYFKTRDKKSLANSKFFESEVDKFLAKMSIEQQNGIFTEGMWNESNNRN